MSRVLAVLTVALSLLSLGAFVQMVRVFDGIAYPSSGTFDGRESA